MQVLVAMMREFSMSFSQVMMLTYPQVSAMMGCAYGVGQEDAKVRADAKEMSSHEDLMAFWR